MSDYHGTIKYPMDMGTRKKRLEENCYDCVDECVIDYKLMFNKCHRFNNRDADISVMAPEECFGG